MLFSIESVELVQACGRKSRGLLTMDGVEPNIGGAYEKGFGVFKVENGSRRRTIPICLKRSPFVYDYIEAHEKLKRLHFPVPVTMRRVQATAGQFRRDQFVAMTDYRSLGVFFFGKALLGDMYEYDKLFESKKRISELPEYALEGFMDAYRHLDDIKKDVWRYAKLATNNHLRLPAEEEYEIVVYPDKRWELLLLDLHTVIPNYNKRNIKKYNDECTWKTINNITAMHKWLVQHQLLQPEPQPLQHSSWRQRLWQKFSCFHLPQ